MGCAASKATPPPDPTIENPVPKPVAFEIPADDSETVNKVTKKPPAQLLKRVEQSQNNPTAEEIKEKLQKAEERRQEILEEKSRIARQAQKVFNKSGSAQNGDDDPKEEEEGG